MGLEIINGPMEVYLAPLTDPVEAFPDISETPVGVGNWLLLGTAGSRHYDEEGVSINMPQEVEKISGLGGTEILKILRTLEELIMTVKLFDLISAQFVKALDLAISTTNTAAGSGTGGHQSFGLLRGLDMTENSLLVRGENKSPEAPAFNIQFEIPKIVQIGSPELVFNKNDKAGLQFELQAVGDYNYPVSAGGFPYGRILFGDAVPT